MVEAAARLFGERDVTSVTLGDIAAEVGLKRNSLYRYFPDMGHLLAAWFRIELAPLQERSEEIAASGAPASERLHRWLDLHLDYLTAPEHQAMVTAFSGSASMSEEVRADIGRGHQELYATLTTILVDADPGAAPGSERAEIDTRLLAGALRSAAEMVIDGTDRELVRGELTGLASAVLVDRPTATPG